MKNQEQVLQFEGMGIEGLRRLQEEELTKENKPNKTDEEALSTEKELTWEEPSKAVTPEYQPNIELG